MYWMNVNFVIVYSGLETRSRTENCRQPIGETHVLPLRPRPVSWCVASETKGEGKADRKRGFLLNGTAVNTGEHRSADLDVLIEESLSACHRFTIEQSIAQTPSTIRERGLALVASREEIIIELFDVEEGSHSFCR